MPGKVSITHDDVRLCKDHLVQRAAAKLLGQVLVEALVAQRLRRNGRICHHHHLHRGKCMLEPFLSRGL